MSDAAPVTCPACGARLAADADVCDLCGTPADAVDLPQLEDAHERASKTDHNSASGASGSAIEQSAVYCNDCGWENPPGARYCSQCGERLQAVNEERAPASASVPDDLPRGADTTDPHDADTSPTPDAETSADVTRRIGSIVGVALLIVVGLFIATTWSQQVDWGTTATDATAPGSDSAGMMLGGGNPTPQDLQSLVEQTAGGSMPASLEEQTAALEAEIAQLSGAEKLAKQQELVNLYVGAGQLARAALVQQRIAEAAGTVEAWKRAGDLLYNWVEQLRGQPPSPSIAEHVVQAYQKVLAQEPGNLNVRTDMATAYLQTNNPMRGVQEINRVLEQDPNHFQARFNKGIMLTMVGRTDEAIAQFEHVKEIVGANSPYYEQAEQAIRTIQQRTNETGS